MLKIKHLYSHIKLTQRYFKNIQALSLVILVLTVNSVFAGGESLDTSFNPVFGGSISTPENISQRQDGKIVVTGSFSVAGGKRQNSVAVFNTDGTLDESFNTGIGVTDLPTTAFIRSHLVLNDNKIIIGGEFTAYQGQPFNSIAKLNSDGSIDTSFNVGTGFNNEVRIIEAQSTNKILVGGPFTTYNSQTVAQLVRLNSDGTIDNSFLGNVVGTVRDIIIQADGKIIVVGESFTVDGVARNGVARLNADGTLDTSFDPGIGANEDVNIVEIQSDGKIFLGGAFTTFNSLTRRGIVKLNSDGTIDNSFNAVLGEGTNLGETESLELLTNGQIIVGGRFTRVNLVTQNNIARLNSDGSLDTSFVSNAETTRSNNRQVAQMLQLADGRILLVGVFDFVNGVSRPGLAALNNNGTLSDTFSTGIHRIGYIYKIIKQPDGKTLIGGDFSRVNGLLHHDILRLNTDGTIDETFDTGSGVVSTDFGGEIQAIALQNDGKILIGGEFREYNGIAVRNIIRLHSNGSLDATFNPQVVFFSQFRNAVYDIVVDSVGKIFVGGGFPKGIGKLNPNGSLDGSFNIGSGFVGSRQINSIIIQPDNKIIASGRFTSFNKVSKNGIARLNPNGSLDTSFVARITDERITNVKINDTRLLNDGRVLIGGFFNNINGISTGSVVMLNPDGTVDKSFESINKGKVSIFSMLIQPDGHIILGGNFSDYNGSIRSGLVRITPNGFVDQSFASNINIDYRGEYGTPTIFALSLHGQELLIGGRFTEINSAKWACLAKITNTLSPQNSTKFDFDGDDKTDVSIFRPDLGQWWYLKSSDFSSAAFAFGTNTDKLVPADYTGDGKTDIAFWRESTGEWFILRSEDSSFYGFPFGTAGDIPAPGDFDGDGIADAAVFRPSSSTWFIQRSSDGGTTIQSFGMPEDKPTVADFDGDGKDDIAIYRPSVSQWWQFRSTDGTIAYQFGASGDKTVQGDYTGDGKADVGIFRPSTGQWLILRSEDTSFFGFPFGTSTDIPSPGDYDGDGTFDAAVFRPSTNTWFYNGSTSGNVQLDFGITGDVPIPNVYSVE